MPSNPLIRNQLAKYLDTVYLSSSAALFLIFGLFFFAPRFKSWDMFHILSYAYFGCWIQVTNIVRLTETAMKNMRIASSRLWSWHHEANRCHWDVPGFREKLERGSKHGHPATNWDWSWPKKDKSRWSENARGIPIVVGVSQDFNREKCPAKPNQDPSDEEISWADGG